MSAEGKRTILLALLQICFLVGIAQPENKLDFNPQYLNEDKSPELVVNKQVLKDRMMNGSINKCPPKRYMGITHAPSIDFNIYLALHNSITPKIMTSFEVSLNYAGVMNIKSLFFLRKKAQADLRRN
ncbi:hypothetical protein [Ekhidna sp. To15]|uniref:hypothetical protein n=1 Tax=Ekhidna sp. To15 TaxID=3395267 RepID=UPI003F5267AE